MSIRRSELGIFGALAVGCAGSQAAPAQAPAAVEAAPQTFVEASEAEPGFDWLALWSELGGAALDAPEAPSDGEGAKELMCVAGCEGEGPYLVRGGSEALALELWVVDLRDGVRVRAPAAIVASHPACVRGEEGRSAIVELDFAEAVGGVELYLAVDLVEPRGQAGEGECGAKRVECQTYTEDDELVAGGPASVDWACFD